MKSRMLIAVDAVNCWRLKSLRKDQIMSSLWSFKMYFMVKTKVWCYFLHSSRPKIGAYFFLRAAIQRSQNKKYKLNSGEFCVPWFWWVMMSSEHEFLVLENAKMCNMLEKVWLLNRYGSWAFREFICDFTTQKSKH